MKTKKWLIKSLLFLVIFLIIAGILFSYFRWRNNYRDSIYPNIKIGNIDLSGLSLKEAEIILNKKTDEIIAGGLVFNYGNKSVTLDAASVSFDSDLSYPILVFNNNESIQRALAYSQPNNFWHYLTFRLSRNNNKILQASIILDEEKIKNLLNDSFETEKLNIPAINSSFSVSPSSGTLVAAPEQLGKEINYDLLFSELRDNLLNLISKPLLIKTHTKYPSVRASDLGVLANDAKALVGTESFKLTFTDTSSSSSSESVWTLKPEKLLNWITVINLNGRLSISLDSEKIKQYLLLNVSPKIDVAVISPRFEIKNGKVNNWQAGTAGRQVDLEDSTIKIVAAFLNGQKISPITVAIVPSENLEADKTLNIKEIIGTGKSDFSGSPTNRRKNIQVGANAVHGVLVAPGEEFSLVKVLGDVSQASGYFPELVIKGNKTLPEYGGGLCQVATTLFRAALASGMPITERRNHSYRVVYYEPAGTDAAVYLPKPDVRFLNDSPNYILIQSRIVGNIAYFDFWGTKDGRVATTTAPVVYNIVKPAPTKFINSSELAPGQKKCTERAHNGADAYFDYKVIYPEGATTTPIQEHRFSSHYVPWQEVCLIGTSASSSASSTINIKPGPTQVASTSSATSSIQ